MENKSFVYKYSAVRNKEVERIRKKYLPHEESRLDRLKALDRKVQGAGTIEALGLGVIGALIFGIGICFMLGVFSGGIVWYLPFMILGVALMIPAYPTYRIISYKTRAKLSPEILRLSEEIINS